MAAAAHTLIRQVIEDFVVWFDSGDFERFRTVWHPGGIMNTTRGRLTAEEFTQKAAANWAQELPVGSHLLCGTSINLAGNRAIAQTRTLLGSRLPVDGVICDITCTARFYDFFELRQECWKIVERQPIYEKDRLDPVDPAARLSLDDTLLAEFPEGYRHLGYAQTRNGLAVERNLPGLRGPQVQQLYARGRAWLAAGRQNDAG